MEHATKSRQEIDAIVAEEFVPGTAHLVDIGDKLNVKKQDGKNSDVVLIPQPTSSPRDPLNWSYRRKLLHYYLLLIWGFLVALNIAFLGPAYTEVEAQLDGATYSKLVDKSAVDYISLGMGCILLQPTAMKIGRRATYMMASVFMLIALICGGTAQDMNALFIYGWFGGIGAAPVDSLVQVSTTDIFFQHERGDKLSAFIFVIYGGSYIGPIIMGAFADLSDGAWRYMFWLCLAVQGFFFIFQVFLMEDSTFTRDEKQINVDETILRQITTEREGVVENTEDDEDKDNENEIEKNSGKVDVEEVGSDSSVTKVQPLSYRERLRLFNFENNDPRPWLVIALRPFFCLSFPPVVFAGVLYGVQIMFLSLTTNTQSEVFSADPYNFTSAQIGFTNFSSLIGSCIGMIWGGRVSDWITVKLARRNNGILEPEMRLYAMAVPTLFTAAGLVAYGVGAYNGVHWFIPAGLGRCFISIGICSCGPIVITYAIDCFPAVASESVVLILFARNLIGCMFTFSISPWVDAVGMLNFTWTLFALALFFNGFSIVMIIYGKQFRRSRKDFYLRFQNRSKNFI